MPKRADIEAATPKCQQRRVYRSDDAPQHGIHYICGLAMRYVSAKNTWRCPECGTLAARLSVWKGT